MPGAELGQVGLTEVIAPLAAALGLSLLVERILELVQNLLERVLRHAPGRVAPDSQATAEQIEKLETKRERDREDAEIERQAEDTAETLEALRRQLTETEDPDRRAEIEAEMEPLRRQLAEQEKDGVSAWDERVATTTLLVEEARPRDPHQTLKPFVLQLLGLAAGVVLARWAQVQLFGTLLEFAGSGVTVPDWEDYVLTGLLIGGGSGPVHVLLRFIEQRRMPSSEPVGAEEEPAGEAPAAGAAPKTSSAGGAVVSVAAPAAEDGDWIDIPYRGGVDREKLEHVHRRGADPDLIIYHHTAMHAESTFDDVVRVITSRTDSRGNRWLTGYNCVVVASGSIHPFCRWDRYGNHVAGHNRRSLGIAFNGNFETDPSVPFSNPDGRYGEPRPGEAQLRAGARVIALWTLLYDIPADFGTTVLPHNALAQKACPGSEFPHAELERWVGYFRRRWQASDFAQERIAAFRLKPYLFVEGVRT